MSNLLSSASALHIVFVTGILGCGCAWLAGRAIASGWRSPVMVVGAGLLMGLAVQFVQFALFSEPLLDATKLVINILVLLCVALLAYRRTRVLQMVRQYYWLYELSGPLGWRPKRAVSE